MADTRRTARVSAYVRHRSAQGVIFPAWCNFVLGPNDWGAKDATFPALRRTRLRYTLSLMETEMLDNLYPELTEEERNEAAENLDRYLTLAWEIYEDLQSGNREL